MLKQTADNSVDKLNSKHETVSGEQLMEACELKGIAILRAASQVYTSQFFRFLTVNLVLVVGFLLILFWFILNYSDAIADAVVNFTRELYLHKALSPNSIASLLFVLLFWVFFSWLRASYISAANNYFKPTRPLSNGLVKLLSFVMVELMRWVIFVIGFILLPFLPFFMARYFIAPAVVVVQNEGGVNALFESVEYVQGRSMKTMGCVIFINLFVWATIISCGLISHLFVDLGLIFWSFNILLYLFVFLPLHSCCRLVLYKKLQQLDGELRVNESPFRQFWFLFVRLGFLTGIVVAVFVGANDRFGEVFDSGLWFVLQLLATT